MEVKYVMEAINDIEAEFKKENQVKFSKSNAFCCFDAQADVDDHKSTKKMILI